MNCSKSSIQTFDCHKKFWLQSRMNPATFLRILFRKHPKQGVHSFPGVPRFSKHMAFSCSNSHCNLARLILHRLQTHFISVMDNRRVFALDKSTGPPIPVLSTPRIIQLPACSPQEQSLDRYIPLYSVASGRSVKTSDVKNPQLKSQF